MSEQTDVTAIELKIGGQTRRSRFGPFVRKVEWNKLPDVAQAFIVRYGLKQFLADAMAGAEDAAQAEAGLDERLAKLISGDLSRARGESDKPDTVDSRALKNARQFLRDQLKAANKTAPKEIIADGAKKLIEANPSWRKEAKKQLEAEAKAREEMANADNASVLADLLASIEPNEEAADDDTPAE